MTSIDNSPETGRPHIVTVSNLLTRDDFRNGVFERDGHKCVVCGAEAKDAHHIMERRLFPDGGYYLDNGASLCSEHHIKAEQTLVSTDDLRSVIGIEKPVIPPHLYRDCIYDKWGNVVLKSGKRLKGELFYDESVQKILEPVLDLFVDQVKYPRTYHLPWSDSRTNDDRTLDSVDHFVGKYVVVTEKMDGENATIYSDGYFHARSTDGNSHPSQSWLKNFKQSWFYDIPRGWRVCGENLYAIHSIEYDDLESYFMAFSVWDSKNRCLPWDETVEWCRLLEIDMVPIMYRGIFDEDEIRRIYHERHEGESCEGYVIRLEDSFDYSEFRTSVAKYVRKNHVAETVHNWRMNWNPERINMTRNAK